MHIIDQLVEIAEGLDCGTVSMEYDTVYGGWFVFINSCSFLYRFQYPADCEDAIPSLDETCREAQQAWIKWMPTYREGREPLS